MENIGQILSITPICGTNFHLFPFISMKCLPILMFSKDTKNPSFSLKTPSLGLYYVIIPACKKSTQT